MKHYSKIIIAAIALAFFASCADFSQLSFPVPSKPASIAFADSLKLNDFNVLKSYVDTTKFKMGAGVLAADFNARGTIYKMILTNFNDVTPGVEFRHGSVVGNDGSFNFGTVDVFMANAAIAGVSIFGHTLCWNYNQNSTYLNSIIAPTVLTGSGQPARYDPLWSQDFETSSTTTSGSVYSTSASNAVSGFTAAGAGKGGVGRALTITNSAVRANDWESQLFFTFPKAVKSGDKIRLTMDVRSDVAATFATQAHTAPGAYKFYDFFGQVASTTTWTTFVKEMTVTSDQDACTTIAFNLGATATTYYFDNAKVEIWNPNPSTTTVPKTDAEKKTIITAALDTWIKKMMAECKSSVKAWDIVNEPISDTDPTQLKTGIGRTLAAGEFYWQDYMGKDYAVSAIQMARQYGNASDKLFINEYGLDNINQLKCQGLIDYITYIESKGVKVDGIGTQLHVTLGVTSLDGIKAMFTKLAATGKLIKISALDMGINTGGTSNLQTAAVTNTQLTQMSDFYYQIVKAYLQLVPAAQRWGITQWAITDSPTNATAWRVGEPLGLWYTNFSRKPAYAGFANALAGK